MRFVVLMVRVMALALAFWAVVSRADCALVTGTCRGFNLFSYFTIHSTILLILAVLLATFHAAVSRAEPVWLTVFRAVATTYMVVSGAVFTVLLANAELFGHLFLVPPSSKVLHFVLPVYAVADFLVGPYRNRLRWSTVWVAMIFPVLWALYTLVRGRLVDWYPYFFLDPHVVGGYHAVGMYALGLSGFILLVALGVVATSRVPLLWGAPVGQHKPVEPLQPSGNRTKSQPSR
ncbi:Pr6Pr family membrane protein [Kocuria aegyptia]|uniref:Pr6Pr family membrane protein n=1 Tax=Kocuria aegyptia TaxID=330943 RepID=A0ABP4WQ91_9MICC